MEAWQRKKSSCEPPGQLGESYHGRGRLSWTVCCAVLRCVFKGSPQVCTPSSYLGIQVTADHASASGMVFSRRQERRKVCRGVGSLREEKVRIAPMERITGVFQPKKREASAPRTMKSAQRNRTVPINKSCRYTTVSSTASVFRRIGIYRLSHLEIGGP